MSSSDIMELTALDAARAIEAGSLSGTELFEAYRVRAARDREAGEEGLNCFTWVASGPGAEHAGPPPAGPAPEPLRGIPVAVKDLFCVKGVPSQAGSRILEGYLPPYTAGAVAKLLD